MWAIRCEGAVANSWKDLRASPAGTSGSISLALGLGQRCHQFLGKRVPGSLLKQPTFTSTILVFFFLVRISFGMRLFVIIMLLSFPEGSRNGVLGPNY